MDRESSIGNRESGCEGAALFLLPGSRCSIPDSRAAVIPDGLEPSSPGCRPGVVAAGPRDRQLQAPESNRTCRPYEGQLAPCRLHSQFKILNSKFKMEENPFPF